MSGNHWSILFAGNARVADQPSATLKFVEAFGWSHVVKGRGNRNRTPPSKVAQSGDTIQAWPSLLYSGCAAYFTPFILKTEGLK